LIGYQTLVNLDPDLDPNRVVLALRVTSTSSSAGLGAVRWQADPQARQRRGAEAVRQVADQSAGHDLGVMDSLPSLRINAYQLCETPLVLAVVATASRHGVSGRGSPDVRGRLGRRYAV
jgi:hypothetical protein